MRDQIHAVLRELDRSAVTSVVFYKRDELTTDLICCEVQTSGGRENFHEEMRGWDALIEWLTKLPDFRADWFSHVSQPAFEQSAFLAYSR
ncbi:hypothetical protein [Sphingomonas sp.]|uniref:hypothetical protein n=1 Tax=Sphingomonas sp. TaxID=28214 RepID=UPI003F720BF1